LLSTAVGIGACESLRRLTNLSVLLKWPNDLMVEDRKLGGILMESRSAADGRVVAVAGMGLNVSWEPGEMPDEIAERGTSIATEMRRSRLGDAPAREQLLGALLTGIERRFDQLLRGDVFDIVTTAESLSALVGREVVVRLPGGEDVSGMVTGLAQDGGLEVVTSAGQRVLTAGEVETVRRR
jgi:BirA family biotin operon repressor/biotin-[acetyl-CoA-carboxylase] ligase